MKHLRSALTFLVFPAILHAKELPEVVDFNDHVQPILSENCYHCHGPDSSTQEPKKKPLRLDREEFAFLPRGNGLPTIVKGEPNRSELIARIISKDPNEVMPTPESHKKPLKPYEVALLKKWIEQGAPYEEHWSFIPPTKPLIPTVAWGENAIDKFIALKHQEKNLQPNKPEAAARLFRRLSFDITGLPPKPEAVNAFIEAAAKDLPNAVKTSVDQLLTTDAYAEHFARHWLDAARYADTHGIHIDNYRAIWPYRDWVIDAFRQNMPFDQFTIKQIAGDLLPNRSLEDQIATGFSRCLPTTGEGGAIAEEYDAIYATDRVETTSAVWLGLTTSCAACHDHKFDPISQKDFYQMTAFFRNTTMGAMDKNSATHPPSIFAPLLSDRARWAEVEQDLKDANESIEKRSEGAREDFKQWVMTQGTAPIEGSPVNTSDILLPLTVSEGKIHGTIQEETRTWDFKGKTLKVENVGEVIDLKNINVPLGEVATFDAKDQVTYGGYIYCDHSANGPVISRMSINDDFRGWDIWLESGKLASHVIDKWPDNAIKAITKSPLKPNTWHHVMITFDGEAAPGKSMTFYVDGKPVPINYQKKGKVKTLKVSVPTRLGARSPNSRLGGNAAFHNFQLYRKVLNQEEVVKSASAISINDLLAVPIEERDQYQKDTIFNFYLSKIDGPSKTIKDLRSKLLSEQNELKKNGSMTLVMEEKKGDAFAHVLDRGEYTERKAKVYADIPELFREGKEERKLDRKDLAEWLVSEKNPLTARVTVNRIWYYLIGRGLVETTEDFGIMGARPTHPELLDYLAIEFMESGWDIHHVIKLITNSATYQLSDKVTSANREKDPTNLYLSRSSRYRLEAEQIRDMALSSSGLLVDKIGGPSVKPYQPGGIWQAVAMKQSNTRYYKEDTGSGLYRRSLYTFWKRSAAPPSMEILNAPTRETFCVRRDRTNTPLQAFVTLNDTQFVEAARALATRALKEQTTFEQRLDHITNALTSRSFDQEEQEIVKKAFTHHLKRYEENPGLAEKLINVGHSKPDTSLPKHELAAWTLVASQIFNLDETLTK